MKKLATLVLFATLTLSAFAADRDFYQAYFITLHETTTVGNTVLKPGNYKIVFEKNQNTSRVTFRQFDNVIASAHALVIAGSPTKSVQVISETTLGGTPHVKLIQLGKYNETIVLE